MGRLIDDLLGDAEIEALLADDTQLALMIAIEQGLAEAEADAGLIEAAAAEAITRALAGFSADREALASGLRRDGVVVPELVRQMRQAVGDPHGACLHKGATSQDIVDTTLVLQLARCIDIYDARLGALLDALERFASEHGGREIMAHTRMQAALPMRLADKIATWADPLKRYRRALATVRPTLLVVQLGGPVGNRESFEGRGGEIARHLARRLDLGIAEPWHAARDPIVGFGGLLALICGTLGKIGADVGMMTQTEVAALKLDGGGTSSAMAHKSNPVAAEVLVALARHAGGLAGTLNQAMVHENERSGAAWTLEWLTLPPLLISTGASLHIGIEMVSRLRPGS